MSAACDELGAALDWIPEPPVVSAAEKQRLAAEKWEKKKERDRLDSLKHRQSWDDKVAKDKAEKAKAAAEKSQTDAKNDLALAISGYQFFRQRASLGHADRRSHR
jgi:hypothetical protein